LQIIDIQVISKFISLHYERPQNMNMYRILMVPSKWCWLSLMTESEQALALCCFIYGL